MAEGEPTGNDLCSGTTDGDTLPTYPTAAEAREITFDTPYSIVSGTIYTIVVRAPSASSNVALYWDMNSDAVADGYSGGESFKSTNSGSNWTLTGAGILYTDMRFITKAAGIEKDSNATGTTPQGLGQSIWFAQSFTATSSYSISSVILQLRQAVGATIGTITVSIRNAVNPPGKAKTPAPTDDEEGVYIHGIDKVTELSWVNPDGETPEYHVYFKYPGDTEWNDFGSTGTTRYYTIDDDMRGLLDYFSIYQWRVDTYDPETELTTTGDTWTFTSMKSHQFTDFTRRSDYDPDQVWQPGTGWVDINTFEYTGGGRYKGRLVVIGHNVIYFGDL